MHKDDRFRKAVRAARLPKPFYHWGKGRVFAQSSNQADDNSVPMTKEQERAIAKRMYKVAAERRGDFMAHLQQHYSGYR